MTAGRRVNTQSQSWGTPHKYVDAIKNFWGGEIALDPCSNNFSIVKANTEYKLPDNDGLTSSWDFKTIFVNPPYGSDRSRGTSIRNWLAKCADANLKFKSSVIALIPVATNTMHWKKYVFGSANAICFLSDTRLKFLVDGNDIGKGAPMACCLVYWGNDVDRFIQHFSPYGATVDISSLKAKKQTSNNEIQTILF